MEFPSLLFGMALVTTILVTDAQLQSEDYLLESTVLPSNVRFRPPIGNGYVATNVLSDTVYANGLFNGREDKSSRARIPAYVAVDVNVTQENDVAKKFVLDMYNGLFVQHVQTKRLDINITYFAHRMFTRLLVAHVDLGRRTDTEGAVSIPLTINRGQVSADFNWQVNQFEEANINATHRLGMIRDPESPDFPRSVVHVFHSIIPNAIAIPANQDSFSITFVASHSPREEDALREYKIGTDDYSDLLESHKTAWHALWEEGRIDIHGNHNLSRDIAAATYNILCSVPSDDDLLSPFFGLSPGGLSRGGLLIPDKPGGGGNDYAGHVFWDMDTWMMPPIMMLHPDMGRRMIGARTRVLNQVKENARSTGYKGAKFPWEQAATGIEATPKWAGNTSLYQIHISADVSYGLRQYLYASSEDDVTLLTSGHGVELSLEIARFWKSRVSENADNVLEILGVMGPDEYHFNIDNSVYTNYNAKLSLTLPQYIYDKYKIALYDSLTTEIPGFNDAADRILILFDKDKQYHPQYEDFNSTIQIKQSDVVLLGYPLLMPMSKEVRRNDLEIYEAITNPEGPDTGTWSMHTVGWLELGDQVRAQQNFKMMFRNINEPFKVFSETPVSNTSNGGCVNFITAAGGLLQAIVFGYGGLRLHPNQLDLNLSPLPNTPRWGITGVHYKGVIFDIHLDDNKVKVKITSKPTTAEVIIKIERSGSWKPLQEMDTFEFESQPASVRVRRTTTHTSGGVSGLFKPTLLIYAVVFVLMNWCWTLL